MATGVMAGVAVRRAAEEKNYLLYAAQQRARRGPTPEVFFTKSIDNSRLVRVADPQRVREMRAFSLAVCALFVMAMVYAWQHFSAIEYGYRIEAQRQAVEQLTEANRQLTLDEASLRDPERIDRLARQMGLEQMQPGQAQRFERDPDAGGPVFARANFNAVPMQ